MGQADDPLENDRHLFFFLAVGSGVEEPADPRQEQRGIHLLDGPRQGVQTSSRRFLLVRHQDGLVHPRERLVGRIFEQARRPDRERVAHLLLESAEIPPGLLGEVRLVEALP